MIGTLYPLSIHDGKNMGSIPNTSDLDVAESAMKSRVCSEVRRISLDNLVELFE